jgi:hypothetical protein
MSFASPPTDSSLSSSVVCMRLELIFKLASRLAIVSDAVLFGSAPKLAADANNINLAGLHVA